MGTCVFRDGKRIEDYGTPYVVAEVNSSHNGNMDTARHMIEAAAESGADCVKFQSWSAETLYSKTYYQNNPLAKRFVKKFSLSSEQLLELSHYAREQGIAFSSTPYSQGEVDFLADVCEVPFIKIASMELDNLAFLRYIGAKQLPVVLSTGMGTVEEIRCAVRTLEQAGVSQMVLLHCVSLYPTPLNQVELRNIEGLREMFSKYPIGFSDHTTEFAAAIGAVALGAALIERHLTLDHTKIGMDNAMATEPEAFKQLVGLCREMQQALGQKERVLTEADFKQREKMRRSVIATRDLKAGTVLVRDDLDVKRPGTGIPPTEMEGLVGKTLKRDVEADTLFYQDDFMDV